MFQPDPGIRPSWGMTVCRMPLWNGYATTRSDLNIFDGFGRRLLPRRSPKHANRYIHAAPARPRRARRLRHTYASRVADQEPTAAARPLGLPGRDICSVCCCLRRAGSRLLIPCCCSVPTADRSGPPAPSRSRPAFQTLPSFSVIVPSVDRLRIGSTLLSTEPASEQGLQACDLAGSLDLPDLLPAVRAVRGDLSPGHDGRRQISGLNDRLRDRS